MKILHVLEDFSLSSGGVRTVVEDLHKRLIENNITSNIITPCAEDYDKVVLVEGGDNPWKYSKNIKQKLISLHEKKEINIIHIHGVWMFPQFYAAKFAHKNNIPYIISCHGMYEPWLWSKGTIKKKTYFNLISKPIFKKANYIHAITNDESLNLRKLFPNTAIVEIPNLIDSTDVNADSTNTDEKYILYLGRIDEKKGIDLLINAYARIKPKGVRLKIAGEFNAYKTQLEGLVKSLQLEDHVDFLGMVIGKEKIDLFKNAFVFVAPSHSEVVGMVNLEAAILRTPVITTHQTGLDKAWSDHGGILVNPLIDEIENALKVALDWTIEERNENGKNLRSFALKKYSWQNRFKDWEKLYKELC